ncbi:IclR family transcriptional regulator [Actinoallomurus acaciae]|uniref:IclR family transcriptional regulator n=1 Tax=Actinoallomurus acaciae TaxID=502577 RepID=A0ABV5YCL3_9ACTN
MGRSKSSTPEESSPASASIQSVERAAALLRLFVPNVPSLGPTEIAQLSGMSVSTAHRYCSALRKAGLLRYDPVTGRYGLGGGCIELGLAAAEGMPIVGLARPLMSEVVARLDLTTVLGVWDEDSVRVIEVNDHTSTPARITVRIGAQLGVFETAHGLLYLTFSRRVRQRFAQSPELERLADRIDATERERCAIVRSVAGPRSIPGTTTAAVPVFLGDNIVASLAIVGPSEGMPADPDSPFVDVLKETAARLSGQLSA